MSASALVGDIYCPVSAPHSNLWLPVPMPVSDITIGHRVGEDLLLQDHLFGPASSVWLPTQGWRLRAVGFVWLSPGTVCCWSAEVGPMGPCWVPAISRRGWAQSPLPRVEAYPPPCLRCHDFADLFHCPGWLPALPMPQVSPKSWLVKGGHEWWDLLQILPSRQISGSRKQSGYWIKKVWLSDVWGFLGTLLINTAVARKRTVTYLQKTHCVFFSCLNTRGFFTTSAAACTEKEDFWLGGASTDHTEY